jgi:hypothetical protein
VENILRPFDELLGLSRTGLLKDARIYLPFWMTVPILSGILRLFHRIFQGRRMDNAVEEGLAAAAGQPALEGTAKVVQSSAAEAPGGRQDKNNLLRYRRSMQSLIAQYVPRGKTIDGILAEMAERWNPLYASVQKDNLVEDVNALTRDFLRPIRRSFLVRSPDLKRIHLLAEQLSTSKSLLQIKKRDALIGYIELYMIRCLQVKQL